jgi:flagellin-like protein
MIGRNQRKRAGISPIISTVILIVVVFSIAAAVSPWMIGIVTETSNETGTSAINEIKCREAAFDFDTGYGTYGASWSFSTVNNTLGIRIKNTGTVTLYNFSFELTINDTIIEYFDATEATQRTSANPLKPRNSAFINASITKDINDTLTSLKVLNYVCPNVHITQDF